MSAEIIEGKPIKQNSKEQADELFDESSVGKPINYKLILDLGMNRIHTVVSKPSSHESIMADTTVFRRTVAVYGIILAPYHTKKFTDKKKELFEKFEDGYQEALRFAPQRGEAVTLQTLAENEYRYAEALLEEIIKLQHENNLIILKKVLSVEKR